MVLLFFLVNIANAEVIANTDAAVAYAVEFVDEFGMICLKLRELINDYYFDCVSGL